LGDLDLMAKLSEHRRRLGCVEIIQRSFGAKGDIHDMLCRAWAA